jgi:ribosome-interacting GTPase 1
MPANLTPEYEKADQRYRQATTDVERLAALEAMLATIPKHKGTEKMQADLKHRLSQLRKSEAKSVHGKGPDPFHIPKSGAGQVVLVGPPNTGKSSRLAATTHANAKIAEFPFTTVVPQPGMWQLDDVQIELVDTPPLTTEHVPTGLVGTIRNADLICVVVEAGDAALEQTELVLGVLRQRGFELRTAARRASDASSPSAAAPQPALLVLNKADSGEPESAASLRELYGRDLEVWCVSAQTKQGLGAWFRRLWELLAMVRVYSKEPGRPAQMERPFVLPAGSTIADLARLIHRDLPETMKFARLWGHSRFAGQQVHKTEVLRDRDIVEIHE